MATTEPRNNPIVGNFTPRQVRIQGGLLLVLGSALVIGVGYALLSIVPTSLHPGVEVNGSTFTGSALQGQVFVGLLAWLELLSVMFVIVGIQQLKTGRRMKALLYPTGVVVLIGAIGIWYFRGLLFG